MIEFANTAIPVAHPTATAIAEAHNRPEHLILISPFTPAPRARILKDCTLIMGGFGYYSLYWSPSKTAWLDFKGNSVWA